tara:strand:- start:2297 stop:3544 length:1248 start_codon:yes stop_codon:yes gene_type:complete
MKNRNFEKILIFLFVASWVNLPGLIYEKWSLDSLTAGHGHNLIPYLLPCLALFFAYYFFRSDWSSRFSNPAYGIANMVVNKSTMEDRVLVVLIIYMILINHITAIADSSESNLRMIMPLITAHFFYWLYKRYSYISRIDDMHDFFGQCVFFSILIMLILQLLMFMGFIPGLVDIADADTREKVTNLIQVNGMHIGDTSYTALILLFLLLFYKIKLPNYIIFIGYVIIFLTLAVNQVRGALLPTAILLLLYFCNKLTVRKVIFLGLTLLIGINLYLNNMDHRVFSFESSANERFMLMEKTFDIFLEHPIFGQGSYFAQNLRFGFNTGLVVHNYYLRFLVSYGVVGFAIFLCYLQPLFLRQFRYKDWVGLFVVFSIFSFDAYFVWAMLIIATFHQNDQKQTYLGVQSRQKVRESYNE